MYIAPGIHRDEWVNLNLDDHDNTDWHKATSILQSRMSERYLDAAALLIEEDAPKQPQDRKFGFAILAICCLCMETFQAFKEGLTDTKFKSQTTIVNFLRQSPSFKDIFTDDDIAKSFYDHYRCGILHQAEVKEDSLVWSVGALRGKVGEKQYVNRTAIFKGIEADFEQYLKDLQNKNNIELRKKFRFKMDFIARKNA